MKHLLRIAHIINPVKVTKSSDLFLAQPITFESMRRARETALGTVDVQLLTTQYPEDRSVIPDFFEQLPDLQRSVLDVQEFVNPQKYPLIKDLLELLNASSDADFFIYTNVDIGLMPNFYLRVKELIDQGHDAFIINRRRLEECYTSPADLPQIYKDKGKSHPGFDCFVFRRELYPKFRLEEICIGVPFVGVTLAHNLFCFAEKFRLIDREWLTFHIGMKILPRRDQEYYGYNRKQFEALWRTFFKHHLPLKKLPYSNKNLIFRHLKWGLNPSLFIFKYIALELKKVLHIKYR